MNEKRENPKESRGFSATAEEASRGESGGNGPSPAQGIKKEGKRKARGRQTEVGRQTIRAKKKGAEGRCRPRRGKS